MKEIEIIIADGDKEYKAIDSMVGRRENSQNNDEIEKTVSSILNDVKENGDAALKKYDRKFGGLDIDDKEISKETLKKAFESVADDLRDALMAASSNIKRYHEGQKIKGYEKKDEDGSILGQIIIGLKRVGLYVPGGTAAYPSTVLMNVIPAKIAGVDELIMVTPKEDKNVFAAAYIAEVDRVFLSGGAQAVAAMAYGTESIPKVDKIVGPGNVFVATAKKQLYGLVDIDMIAGPSEILIIADEYANPGFIAADLLSQAEHDKLSASVLLTTDKEVAGEVAAETVRQLDKLERKDIAEESLKNNGRIILCRSEDEMVKLANIIAPEHLEIMVDDPLRLIPEIRNAGSVFCGDYSPEPLGDYYSGTNHVLPTSGTARFASPLGVHDFIKRMSYTYYQKESLKKGKDDIIAIGEAEGLTAHVKAVEKRFE